MAGVAAKCFPRLGPVFTALALWLTVALTAASGAIYLWRNRRIYLDDV